MKPVFDCCKQKIMEIEMSTSVAAEVMLIAMLMFYTRLSVLNRRIRTATIGPTLIAGNSANVDICAQRTEKTMMLA